MQKYRDLDLPTTQNISINCILAHFIGRLGMSLPSIDDKYQNERRFLEEAIIVVCLVRKFLNEKGYRLAGAEGSSAANYPEYCSIKKNTVDVLVQGLDEFFYESYPCYWSNILRQSKLYQAAFRLFQLIRERNHDSSLLHKTVADMAERARSSGGQSSH